MARGQQQQAKQTYQQAQGVSNTSQTNANQLYNQLMPQLSAEATNPQGYSPTDLSAMNTASGQSVGGSTAGAVGEGAAAAARTRNSGSFAPAADETVRVGERQLANNALQTQTNNANLKEAQRQAGLAGLSGLYGTNTSALLSSLGLQNQSTQTGTQAGQSGWFQNMMGLIGGLGQAAGGAGSLVKAING